MKNIFLLTTLLLLFNASLQSQELFLAIKKNKKWGVINPKGEKIIEPKYDFIGNFTEENTALAMRNERLGLLNSEGEEIIEFDNIYASFLNPNLVIFLNQKYKLLNAKGEELLTAKYDSIFVSKIPALYGFERERKFVKAVQGERFILLDLSGKKITPTPIDSVQIFKNRFVQTFLNAKVGLIDSTGNSILPNRFTRIEFIDNQIQANIGKKMGLYSLEGKELFPPKFEEVKKIGNTNFYWGKSNRKIGVFTQNGVQVLPLEYDDIEVVNNVYLILKKNNMQGMYFLLEKKWTFKLEYGQIDPYQPKGNNAIYFSLSKDGKRRIVDISGREFLEGSFDNIRYDAKNQVFYTKNKGKIGFSGVSGSITPRFDYISAFNKNLAIVSNKNRNGQFRRGLVNIYGTVLIEPVYQEIKVKGYSVRCYRADGKTDVLTLDQYQRAVGVIEKNLKIREIKIVSNGKRNKSKDEELEFDMDNTGLEEFTERRRFRGRVTNRMINNNRNRTVGSFNTPTNQDIRIGKYTLRVFSKIIADEKKDERGRVIRVDSVEAFGVRNVSINKMIIPPRMNNDIDRIIEDFRKGKVTVSGLAYVNIEGKGITLAEYKDRSGKIKKSNIMKSNPFNEQGLSTFNVKGFYRKADDLRGGYWGIMNRQGQVVNIAQYEEIIDNQVKKEIKYTYVRGKRKQVSWKLGLLDSTGKEIIPVKYHTIKPLEQSNGKYLLVTERKKRYGILDEEKDEIIINVDYLDIQPFSEDVVAVKVSENYDSAWSFVNVKNQIIHEPAFSKVRDFSSGYGAVKQKNFWGFLDKNGNMRISPSFARVGDFHEDLAYFYKSARYGYINPQLDTIIQPIYRKAGDFYGGRAVVKGEKKNDGFGVIDKKGNWIIQPNYAKIENFNEYALAQFKKSSKDTEYGLMHANGTILFANKYRKIWEFQEGIALVKSKKNKYNFIDTLGNERYEEELDYVRNSVTRVFNEGITAFRKGNLWGFVNSKGEMIIEAQYKDVANFNLGICKVRSTDNKEFYIDKTGQKVNKDAVEQVFERDDVAKKLALSTSNVQYFKIPKKKKGKYVAIMVGEFKGVADQTGNFILEPIYQNIEYVGEDIFRLEKDGGIGYWHLSKGWIWEFSK